MKGTSFYLVLFGSVSTGKLKCKSISFIKERFATTEYDQNTGEEDDEKLIHQV